MKKSTTVAKDTGQTSGLDVISKLTEKYAIAHRALTERVRLLEVSLLAARRQHWKQILLAVTAAKDARANLEAAIKSNAGEFVKPKTRTFFGIRIGFKKKPGKLSWADPASVVALIKKHFPDQQKVLIHTEETPVKDAISQLTVAEAKKIGCSVTEDSDEVYVATPDSDIDKAVDALMKKESSETTK